MLLLFVCLRKVKTYNNANSTTLLLLTFPRVNGIEKRV